MATLNKRVTPKAVARKAMSKRKPAKAAAPKAAAPDTATLRDEFAQTALIGLLSYAGNAAGAAPIVASAYALADQMLWQRSQT